IIRKRIDCFPYFENNIEIGVGKKPCYIALSSIQLPLQQIPLFIFKPNTYCIGFMYNNQCKYKVIEFKNITNVPNPELKNDQQQQQQQNLENEIFYYVYNMEHFIEMINDTIEELCKELDFPSNYMTPYLTIE